MENPFAWDNAEKHLKACEEAYSSIGSAGYFGLVYVLRPLRDRFNNGERSEELRAEIMGVSL